MSSDKPKLKVVENKDKLLVELRSVLEDPYAELLYHDFVGKWCGIEIGICELVVYFCRVISNIASGLPNSRTGDIFAAIMHTCVPRWIDKVVDGKGERDYERIQSAKSFHSQILQNLSNLRSGGGTS